MKTMDCHEDLDYPYPAAEEIPRYAFNVEKEIFVDIFISVKSPCFISRQSSILIGDFCANKRIQNDEDVLQQLIQLPEEEYLSMLEKCSYKPAVSPLVSEQFKLSKDPVPEERQEPTTKAEETIDKDLSLPQDFRTMKNLAEEDQHIIRSDGTPKILLNAFFKDASYASQAILQALHD